MTTFIVIIMKYKECLKRDASDVPELMWGEVNLIKLGGKGSDSKFVLHQRQANKDQEGD